MTVITCDQTASEGNDGGLGGKGRNLHALNAAGFAVPRWAVLPTDAFDTALNTLGIRIRQDPLSLEDRLWEAAHAQAVLRAAPLPESIREDIAVALDHVGSGPFAVRSSANQEDGSLHSFAGLFDSFLNLTDSDAVEDAVRLCWASAFSPQVTHYRHVRGLGFGDVSLAVIIQKFVEPLSSGVMFTADPVSGTSDRIVINGVLGLGEGLVSGAVDPDAVVIDKNTGRVLDETVAEKPFMVSPSAAGGTASVPVPAARQRDSAISPTLRTALTNLASRLEGAFGGNQDVEWACDGVTTWILQTRPITTLGPQGGSAAEHLGEDVGPGQIRIWDNSNIIESFAGVTSPLTFTVARQLYGDVYRAYARSLKVAPAQLEQMEAWLPVMLGQFNGNVYYNLLHWYRMVGIAPGYALNRRVLEVALGVSEPLDRSTAITLRPFVFPSLLARAIARARTTLAFVRSFFSIDDMVRDFDATFSEFIASEGLADVSGLDGVQAYRRFRETYGRVADIWGPMLVVDAILLTSVGVLAVLMKALLPKAPEWVRLALLNPGIDMASVEPARALVDIAAFVETNPKLRAFIDSVDPAVAYASLREHADEAHSSEWDELRSRVDSYIDLYGYRCLDELKLEAPDLRQNPAGIFHLLRMTSVDEGARASDLAQSYLNANLRGPQRRIFDALRAKVRRAGTFREHLRFCRTHGFGIIKSLAAVMGRDLEERGIIASRSDIFQLRLDELFDVYEGAVPGAQVRALIARRKLLEQRYRQLAAPARFTTIGCQYTAEELEAAGWRQSSVSGQAAAGTVLIGTPSSPGTVTGRAVLVEKPEDFSSGILVAYRTEPAWAAALPFASGLLIERASPLTHVAIIARELGVPTVVQIDGLTEAVRTGMTVSVDGATGRVTVLEDRTDA